jgi:hypothetical protein
VDHALNLIASLPYWTLFSSSVAEQFRCFTHTETPQAETRFNVRTDQDLALFNERASCNTRTALLSEFSAAFRSWHTPDHNREFA